MMVARTASMRSMFVMMFCPLHRPVKLFLDNPSQWGDVELLVLHTIKSAKVRAEDTTSKALQPGTILEGILDGWQDSFNECR